GMGMLEGIGTGQNDGHQADPVSYGGETGHIHPDSYLDEGEYSPHGDTGGPGSPEGLAGDTPGNGTHLAGHGAAPAEAPTAPVAAPPTTAEHMATSAEPPANPPAAPPDSA